MLGWKEKDPRGLCRWCYSQINGQDRRKIITVVAYRLGTAHEDLGYNTLYHQQYRDFRLQNVDHPKPQKNFTHMYEKNYNNGAP